MFKATFDIPGQPFLAIVGHDLDAIRAAWETYRDQSGIGASDMSNGRITRGNELVGIMTYNGRIWAPDDAMVA